MSKLETKGDYLSLRFVPGEVLRALGIAGFLDRATARSGA